jgi:hypothetical protein
VIRLAWIAMLLLPLAGHSAPQDAVVRIPSHGLSGVVIWTEQGRTLIATAAHGFQGYEQVMGPNGRPMRGRPMKDVPLTIRAPIPQRGNQPNQKVGVKLLSVDHNLDLALVELNAGPLPYVCPVAPKGHRPARAVSVGYDHGEEPMVVAPATLIGSDGQRTYTRENPVPGRSGGAIMDPDQNVLLGCCTGFETQGPRRGIYSSLDALWSFLDHYNGRPVVSEQREQRQQGRPRVQEYREPKHYQRTQPYCPDGQCPGGT